MSVLLSKICAKSKCLHLRVHLPLDLTPLTGSITRVHDDLRVLASVQNDANSPAGVPEDSTTEEHHTDIDRGLLLV